MKLLRILASKTKLDPSDELKLANFANNLKEDCSIRQETVENDSGVEEEPDRLAVDKDSKWLSPSGSPNGVKPEIVTQPTDCSIDPAPIEETCREDTMTTVSAPVCEKDSESQVEAYKDNPGSAYQDSKTCADKIYTENHVGLPGEDLQQRSQSKISPSLRTKAIDESALINGQGKSSPETREKNVEKV